ncbi:MAG: hypothetical protein AAF827_22720 [Cyanobacteria bacterium P01_D01_bin.6]
MLIYSLTAALVFSFISHTFYQDDSARKDNIQAWLFIAFAASIWPITLPNIVRKVASNSMNAQQPANTFNQPPNPYLAYGSLRESTQD